MSEQWNSYFCNVNDKLASIALDLSLASKAPMTRKPFLLWIWVYMLHARQDGLSSNSEFEVLSSIEDTLNEALGKACGAVQAGRITTDGHREFYFYAPSDSRFEAAVTSAMCQFDKYKFDLDSQEDRNWSQYFDVLYPSKEDLRKMRNSDVLDVLMKHGDDLESERNVDHWIYFRLEEDRTRFIAEVEDLGYTIVGVSEADKSERRFCLQVCRNQRVTKDKIDDAVIELFRLAERMDAEYDGWETQVTSVKN